MPRGVEHAEALKSFTTGGSAIFPVMPRGVEHEEARAVMSRPLSAIFPVMPRGVEHAPLAKRSYLLIGRFFR